MRDGYYYGTQAVQFSFFMVPKILLSAPPFRGLSMEAKMLYCIAMDRMSLSAKNGWLDDKQRVYIILTISEIMESMCCASQKATKLLQELEKYRLIEKKRQGHCKPNLIYVKDFTCLIDLSQFKNGENHNSGDVKIEIPEFPKSQCNNTDLNNTYFSNTDSFFPSASPPMAADGMMDGTEIREKIREQIEYDIICSNYDRAQLDELVEIMLEVAMNRSPTIKIGRDAEYPTPFVQQRFSKITSMHIEKVMAGIRENTTRVWNTKAYLMAALFNSVSTIDNYYAQLVNHDLYGSP